MKRWIGILLFTLTATLCISFFTACGEEYSEGLNFVLMEDGTYGVRCGKVTSEEIVIPSERFGIPVTKILDGFFIHANTKMELYGYDIGRVTVKLPESVTEIGDGAFDNSSVTCTVMLSASVKHIGKEAFASSAVDVVIPADSKLETIGENAFTQCGITEFTAPATLRSIESRAFYGCKKLTWADLSLATELKKIPAYCFESSALKGIALSEGLEIIDHKAFNGSALDSITLPESVKIIENSAFAYCYKLKTVDIPLEGELEEIGAYAFESCVLIKSFKLPKKLSTLANNAFSSCNGLVEVYVPETSRVKTKVNSSYLGIGGYGILFIRTDMEGQSIVRRTDDGFLYISRSGIMILMGYDGDETEITLPDTLEGKKYSIAPYAFYYSDVTRVTLSGGVNGIGDSAFEGSYLEWINIPESVARIGKNVFRNLSSIDNLLEIVFEGESEWIVGGNIVSSERAATYLKYDYAELEWIKR